MNNIKIAVAMSGGVDSSVCAYLLKKQGHEVIGITMEVLNNKEYKQDTERVSQDASCVAKKLGIPHYTVDFTNLFDKKVIEYFTKEYLKGMTPNPCVVCNRYLKFDALLKKALELNVSYIATGHYAKVEIDSLSGRYLIKKAIDSNKDQSYMLYRLTQYQLEHILLPLGFYKKPEIRKIAKEADLLIADKPDSQEICFISDDYKSFLSHRVPNQIKSGYFVNKQGDIIGEHKGIPYYTVGQRRGLGISADKPLYVIKIDAKNNRIILGDESDLYTKEFVAYNMNWISIEKLEDKLQVNAKIRYNFAEKPAQVIPLGADKVKVIFEQPQKAVAPGQSVVFYKDDVVVGGGIIIKRSDL